MGEETLDTVASSLEAPQVEHTNLHVTGMGETLVSSRTNNIDLGWSHGQSFHGYPQRRHAPWPYPMQTMTDLIHEGAVAGRKVKQV